MALDPVEVLPQDPERPARATDFYFAETIKDMRSDAAASAAWNAKVAANRPSVGERILSGIAGPAASVASFAEGAIESGVLGVARGAVRVAGGVAEATHKLGEVALGGAMPENITDLWSGQWGKGIADKLHLSKIAAAAIEAAKIPDKGLPTGEAIEKTAGEYEQSMAFMRDQGSLTRLGMQVGYGAGYITGFVGGLAGKVFHGASKAVEAPGALAVGKVAANVGEKLVEKGAISLQALQEAQAANRFIPEIAKALAKDSKLQAAALRLANYAPRGLGSVAGLETFHALQEGGAYTDPKERLESPEVSTAARFAQVAMEYSFPLLSRFAELGQIGLVSKLGEGTWSKAFAAQVRGAIEGTGFSMTDVHFLGPFLKAVNEGDTKAMVDALGFMAGTSVAQGLMFGRLPKAQLEHRRDHPQEHALPAPVYDALLKRQEGIEAPEPAPTKDVEPGKAEVPQKTTIVEPLEALSRQGWQVSFGEGKPIEMRLPGVPGRITVSPDEATIRLSEQMAKIADSERELGLDSEEAQIALERIADATMVSNAVSHAYFGGKGEEMGGGLYFDGTQRGAFRFGKLLRQEASRGPAGKSFWEEVAASDRMQTTDPYGRQLVLDPAFSPGLQAVRRIVDASIKEGMTEREQSRQTTAEVIVQLLEHAAVEDGIRNRAQAEAMIFLTDPRVQALVASSPEHAARLRDTVVRQLGEVLSGAVTARAALEQMAAPKPAPAPKAKTKEPIVVQPDQPAQARDERQAHSLAWGRRAMPMSAPPGLAPGEHIVRRSEIVKTLEDLGGATIRSGGMHFERRGSLGLFFSRSGGIRIKEHLDIGVGAHEAGHALHKRLERDLDKPFGTKIDPELDRLGRELYGDTVPGVGHYRAEGFAEAVARHLLGEDIRAVAPNFKAWLDTRLSIEPKIARAWKRATEQFKAWRDQGAVARVASMVLDPFEKQQQTPALQRAARELAQGVIAYSAPLETLERTYMRRLEEQGIKPRPSQTPSAVLKKLEGASPGIAQHWLERAAVSMTGGKIGPSLKAVLGPVALEDMKAFKPYMVAKRALEYFAKGKEPGMDRADAERTIADLESRPGFQKALEGFKRYANLLLDYEVEAGSLSPERAQRIKDSSDVYVRFQRLFDPEYEKQHGLGTGLGFAAKGTFAKKIEGSQRELQNPLNAMALLTYATIARANKARVGRAIADFAELGEDMHKFAEKVETPDEDTVTLYRNGKEEHWSVHPDLMKVMTGMDNVFIRGGMLMNMALGASHLLRFGATGVNAGFAIGQMWLDTVGSLVYTRSGIKNPLTFLKGYANVVREAASPGSVQHVTDIRAQGGKLGPYLGEHTWSEIFAAAERLKPGLRAEYREGGIISNPAEWARAIGSGLKSVTDALSLGDMGPRSEEYRAALARARQKPGYTEEDAQIEAMTSFKDLTLDFTRKGTMLRILNAVSPYTNAWVRGTSKFIDTFFVHPKAEAWARAIAYVTVPTLINWWLNKDEKWFKELPLWRRAIGLSFSFDDGKTVWTLPMPPLLNSFFGKIPEAMAEYAYERQPAMVEETAWQLLKDVVPARALVPAVVRPTLEVSINKDLMTGRDIHTERELKDKLPEERFGKHTTEMAKWVGQALDVSPKSVEVWLRDTTGGLAVDAMRLLDMAMGVSKSKGGTDAIPILRRFLHEGPMESGQTRQLDEFYDTMETLRQRDNAQQLDAAESARLHGMERASRRMSDLRRRRDAGSLATPDANAQIQRLAEQALEAK